jgi:hypothetical protein
MTTFQSIVAMSRQRWLLRRHRRLLLLLGLIAIPIWQAVVWQHAGRMTDAYHNTTTLGVFKDYRFVCFYRHLGLYPVTSELTLEDHSTAGCEAFITAHGDSLLMEYEIALRYGDLGQMFLFLPHAWLKGDCRDLSAVPANGVAFIIALMAAFAALWWLRLPLLGTFLVLIVGSNPFQLHEVYQVDNVFAWPITTLLLLLAVNAPMLAGGCRQAVWRWSIPAISGVLLGSILQLRSEPALVLASVAVVYLTQARESWCRRIGMLLLLGVCFVVTKRTCEAYFNAKFVAARTVVENAGGHPYPGPRDFNHRHWHPLFMGLHDFDTKYGYRWDDRHPALYAFPILQERYGIEIPEYDTDGWGFVDFYLDPGRKYRVEPQQLPHYSEVIRAHVLSRIFSDPLWYLTIVAKRLGRVLTETTPVRIGIGAWTIPIPFSGWLFLPVLVLLCRCRHWLLGRFVCFGLATSIPAVAIFSDGGMCWYSVYHNFVAALCLAWLVETLIVFSRSGNSTQQAVSPQKQI